jgi:hypothetical protein
LASWPCRALGFDIVVSWSLFLLVGKCRKTSSEIKYLDVSDVYLSIPLETKHRSVRLLSSIVRCKTSQPWLSGASGVGAGNIAEHGAASNLIVDELISSLSFNYIIYIYQTGRGIIFIEDIHHIYIYYTCISGWWFGTWFFWLSIYWE